MTKAEREKIKRAIDLILNDECDVPGALTILAPMVGLRYPAGELKKLKPVNFFKVMAGKNRKFKAGGQR